MANTMAIDKNILFQLSPREFERLCAEILKVQGIEHVELVSGPNDQGVDIIGESKGQLIAVQVKHMRRLSQGIVHSIITDVQASSYKPQQLLIMTSATIPSSLRELIQNVRGITVSFIGQDEVLRALNDHPEIIRLQVEPAQKRTVKQRWELTLGLTAALLSIVASLLLSSGTLFFAQPEKPQLQERIINVERAIGSLKDLEKQLVDIKGDMVETEKAAKVIEQEYAKAKELEKLTQEQFEAVKSALWSQAWQKTALNYGLGFVLGIASSLIASVIYARIRQNRALKEGSNNA